MRRKSDRLIIDTNLWISYLISRNSKIDDLLEAGKATILVSQHLLNEIVLVAARPKLERFFPKEDFNNLINSIHLRAYFINITSRVDICRDPKDNFLLELAEDGNATHLLTGDKDLLALVRHKKTKIVTLGDYFKS